MQKILILTKPFFWQQLIGAECGPTNQTAVHYRTHQSARRDHGGLHAGRSMFVSPIWLYLHLMYTRIKCVVIHSRERETNCKRFYLYPEKLEKKFGRYHTTPYKKMLPQSQSIALLHCTVLHHSALYFTIMHYALLYYTMFNYTILYRTVPHRTK